MTDRGEAAQPSAAPTLADRLAGVRRFLNGEGFLDGYSFGDQPPGEYGRYWWRNRIMPTLDEAAAALRATAPPSGESVFVALDAIAAGGCESFATGDCFAAGRIVGAKEAADAACHPCVARRALDAAPVQGAEPLTDEQIVTRLRELWDMTRLTTRDPWVERAMAMLRLGVYALRAAPVAPAAREPETVQQRARVAYFALAPIVADMADMSAPAEADRRIQWTLDYLFDLSEFSAEEIDACDPET